MKGLRRAWSRLTSWRSWVSLTPLIILAVIWDFSVWESFLLIAAASAFSDLEKWADKADGR